MTDVNILNPGKNLTKETHKSSVREIAWKLEIIGK